MAEFERRKPVLSHELPHQRAVLKFMALLAAPAGFVYAVINFSREMYFFGTLECIYVTILLIIVRKIETTKKIKLFSSIITLPMLALITFGILSPDTSITMFVWVLCIPAISYITMGAKNGFLITGFLYILIGIKYALHIQGDPSLLSAPALMNAIICAIALWTYSHIYENFRAKSYARLENLASRDALTGLYNRLRMADIYSIETENSAHMEKQLGLIMIDLDHFKSINDTYGHDAGDEVLRTVAKELQRTIRSCDYVFRMGGEEFCAMIININQEELHDTAENLRAKIAALKIDINGHPIPITASFGCTLAQKKVRTETDSLVSMLQKADEYLYTAKNSGRNCVITCQG